MKDNTRESPPDNAGGDKRNDYRDASLASYTPQQRRTILKGLRILARVAIRSYLRQQAEQDQDRGESGGAGS